MHLLAMQVSSGVDQKEHVNSPSIKSGHGSIRGDIVNSDWG